MELDMLKTEDAASYLNCSKEQIGVLRKQGYLKGYRAGKRWMFMKSDIESFAKAHPEKLRRYRRPLTMILKGKCADGVSSVVISSPDIVSNSELAVYLRFAKEINMAKYLLKEHMISDLEFRLFKGRLEKKYGITY